MTRFIVLVGMLLCVLSYNTFSQIHPAEGSKLNYRLIGFSFPSVKGCTAYKIEVAAGNQGTEALFKQNTIRSATSATNKTLIEVPAFSAEYTWRVTTDKPGTIPAELHHFSTLNHKSIAPGNYRLIIVQSAAKYKDAYVISDASRVMYNMMGEPVWFLPDIKGLITETSVLRDIKITPQNTITFLNSNTAYEINYDGKILWRGPNNGEVSGDSEEHYHHELTKLSNGHYMVLGQETLTWEWKHNGNDDSTAVIVKNTQGKKNTGKHNRLAVMGTVIEYDPAGNVVWSWKSSSHYRDEKLLPMQGPMGIKDIHENAFFFDEKKKELYVSFKNASQVLRIKYPEGKVLNVYDGLELQTGTVNKLSLFSEQHGISISSKGDLYLYNNNMANTYVLPNVLLLKQPTTAKGEPKKIWDFEYPDPDNHKRRDPMTSGGNVIELPDQSVFISACSPYSNIFIVGKDKKLLWDARLENWDIAENKWALCSLYRASIITSKKKLEQLIWNSVKTE